MGYSTDFEGEIKIEPALSQYQARKINAFCADRHGGNCDVFPGMPGFWCNYKVNSAGDRLMWNGSEKSYAMDEWLPVLINEFCVPRGHVLNGTLVAQGEDSDDRWRLVVKDNTVTRLEGHASYDDFDMSEQVSFDELTTFIAINLHHQATSQELSDKLLKKFNVMRKVV